MLEKAGYSSLLKSMTVFHISISYLERVSYGSGNKAVISMLIWKTASTQDRVSDGVKSAGSLLWEKTLTQQL